MIPRSRVTLSHDEMAMSQVLGESSTSVPFREEFRGPHFDRIDVSKETRSVTR